MADRRTPPADPAEPPQSSPAPRVIVADPNAASREITGERLRADGYNVVLTASGEIALERLSYVPADAMIVDEVMPGLGGVEVCRRVRRLQGRERTLLLILASSESSLAHRAALEAGADEIVTRTPDLGLLRARLRDLLQRARTRETPPPPSGGARPAGPPSEPARAVDSKRGPTSKTRGAWSGPESAQAPNSNVPSSRSVAPNSNVPSSRSAPWPSAPNASSSDDAPPPSSKTPGRFFIELTIASGLPEAFAASALERACRRSGVNPALMSPSDVLRALPHIRAALAMFFKPEEVEQRVRAMTAVAFPARTPPRSR